MAGMGRGTSGKRGIGKAGADKTGGKSDKGGDMKPAKKPGGKSGKY